MKLHSKNQQQQSTTAEPPTATRLHCQLQITIQSPHDLDTKSRVLIYHLTPQAGKLDTQTQLITTPFVADHHLCSRVQQLRIRMDRVPASSTSPTTGDKVQAVDRYNQESNLRIKCRMIVYRSNQYHPTLTDSQWNQAPMLPPNLLSGECYWGDKSCLCWRSDREHGGTWSFRWKLTPQTNEHNAKDRYFAFVKAERTGSLESHPGYNRMARDVARTEMQTALIQNQARVAKRKLDTATTNLAIAESLALASSSSSSLSSSVETTQPEPKKQKKPKQSSSHHKKFKKLLLDVDRDNSSNKSKRKDKESERLELLDSIGSEPQSIVYVDKRTTTQRLTDTMNRLVAQSRYKPLYRASDKMHRVSFAKQSYNSDEEEADANHEDDASDHEDIEEDDDDDYLDTYNPELEALQEQMGRAAKPSSSSSSSSSSAATGPKKLTPKATIPSLSVAQEEARRLENEKKLQQRLERGYANSAEVSADIERQIEAMKQSRAFSQHRHEEEADNGDYANCTGIELDLDLDSDGDD
jgi:hypothetical protein